VFERFTDRARRVVVLAQEESRSFGHGYIGTEHLLLGLIGEAEGIAAAVLTEDLGLTLEGMRDALDARVGRSADHPKGHIPFTPRAKKVLEVALRRALRLAHDYIGTEHVLLALVEEGEGVAAQMLMAAVDGGLDAVEDAAMARLVAAGSVGKGEEHYRQTRRRMRERAVASMVGDDQVIRRLEAIEARLSAIEAVLRDLRGEQAG
jgi:ATP-dependent Clp protease ATP-binding subunit ClpA